MAQELTCKYHSCLPALYNKERAYLLRIENQKEGQTSQEKEAYPLVFSELLAYIHVHVHVVETKTSSDGPPIFRLARWLPFTFRDICTRLKDKLLSEIPELKAHKKGSDILLAFKKDIGSALPQASNYSETIILAKAA